MSVENKYGYIETWTSARWVRERNPQFGVMINPKTGERSPYPNSVQLYPYLTIRLDPITQQWHPITEADDDYSI